MISSGSSTRLPSRTRIGAELAATRRPTEWRAIFCPTTSAVSSSSTTIPTVVMSPMKVPLSGSSAMVPPSVLAVGGVAVSPGVVVGVGALLGFGQSHVGEQAADVWWLDVAGPQPVGDRLVPREPLWAL